MKNKRTVLGTAGGLLLASMLLLSSCSTAIAVNHRTMSFDGIPEEWNEKTIVFIADTQINDHLPDEYFITVTEKIQDLEPDIILISGDFVDEHTSDLDRAMVHLTTIAQVAPTYGVLGNHDNRVGQALVSSRLESAEIQLLDNRNTRLNWPGGDLVLAGLADLYTDNPDPEAAFAGTEANDFVILLTHSPEVFAWDSVREKGDLVLAGHTHGGQVTFFGLWAPLLPLRDRTYWRGEYQQGDSRLLVTNGVGVYGIGMRMFADPGIEVLTLISK